MNPRPLFPGQMVFSSLTPNALDSGGESYVSNFQDSIGVGRRSRGANPGKTKRELLSAVEEV